MRRKYLRRALCAVIFMPVLAVGLWVFAPWDLIGRYVFDTMRQGAAQNGIYITCSGFETSGVFTPTFTLRGLDIDQGMTKFTLAEANIRVLPLSGLFAAGASCAVTFREGELLVIPENRLGLSEGSFKLTVSRSAVTLANVGIAGDAEASGSLRLDSRNRSVADSSLTIRVPSNVDNMMKNPLVSGKIREYLEPVSNGEWRVKRNASPSS